MDNTLVKRDYSIDILKLISCIGIVALHTLNITLGYANLFLGLLTVLCVPIFLVCNGYLIFLKKTHNTYKYVFLKILRILVVCFCWEMLHALLFWPLGGLRNFPLSFVKNFIQQGLFYHFWFFGVLIVIYLVMPLLGKLLDKSIKGYVAIIVCCAVVSTVLMVCSLVLRTPIIKNVFQTFRLWVWLLYFMMGGLVARYKESITVFVQKNKWKMIICTMVHIIVSFVWVNCVGKFVYFRRDVQYFYEELPVILTVICFFVTVVCNEHNWRVCNKISQHLCKDTMGVYIIHPFVLSVINVLMNAVMPMDNAMINILFWIVVVVVSFGIVEVIRRIPLIKKLTML